MKMGGRGLLRARVRARCWPVLGQNYSLSLKRNLRSCGIQRKMGQLAQTIPRRLGVGSRGGEPDFHTNTIQGCDTTDRSSAGRRREAHLQPPPPHKRNPRVLSLRSRLGAVKKGVGGTPWADAMIRIFNPTPFRGRTPGFASPRRELLVVPQKLWPKRSNSART